RHVGKLEIIQMADCIDDQLGAGVHDEERQDARTLKRPLELTLQVTRLQCRTRLRRKRRQQSRQRTLIGYPGLSLVHPRARIGRVGPYPGIGPGFPALEPTLRALAVLHEAAAARKRLPALIRLEVYLRLDTPGAGFSNSRLGGAKVHASVQHI